VDKLTRQKNQICCDRGSKPAAGKEHDTRSFAGLRYSGRLHLIDGKDIRENDLLGCEVFLEIVISRKPFYSMIPFSTISAMVCKVRRRAGNEKGRQSCQCMGIH